MSRIMPDTLIFLFTAFHQENIQFLALREVRAEPKNKNDNFVGEA
jgi:hypothetical protein